MKRISVASLCIVVALVTPFPVHTQGPSTNLTAINARLTALEATVAALQARLDAEAVARAAADTAEASARTTADSTLQTNITSEAASRGAADTALDSRVGKLEGNITAADLVGRYAVAGIDIPLSAALGSALPGGPRPATIQTDAFTGTLTLGTGGVASLVMTACGSSILTQGSWSLTSQVCAPGTGGDGVWSYANGTLALSIPALDFDKTFSVGVGGRLLTTAFAPFHTADKSSNNPMIIGSRLQ